MNVIPDHYVYVYRDPETNAIRYVGKGTGRRVDAVIRDVYDTQDPNKMAARLDRHDKQEVRRWFANLHRRNHAPVVEVMPCEDDAQATAVEAGLISALWDADILNKVHGHHRRFTPLGLPERLTDRRYRTALTRDDIAKFGAVVVYVNSVNFSDDDPRGGSIPLLARTESQAQRQRENTFLRICRWWQIGSHLDQWIDEPTKSPSLVLGVTGPPARRWVWGSLKLNRRGWSSLVRQPGGLYALPAVHAVDGVTDGDLDARRLRGRRIAVGEFGGRVNPDGTRQFNAIRSQVFDVVDKRDSGTPRLPDS